jgi:flavorubredoxin
MLFRLQARLNDNTLFSSDAFGRLAAASRVFDSGRGSLRRLARTEHQRNVMRRVSVKARCF